MPSNHLILCQPFLLLPSIFPSIRVFSSESVLHIRWPKYWSLSFRISPSNEYSELISFRIDWFDLLTVQGTLKSFLQHHSSEASMSYLWAPCCGPWQRAAVSGVSEQGLRKTQLVGVWHPSGIGALSGGSQTTGHPEDSRHDDY